MIVASIALLAGIPAASAQEGKLVDRILRPNMSLVNSAQNKQFEAVAAPGAKHAPSTSFYPPDKSFAKSFPAQPALSPRQLAARHFRAGDTTANVSTRSQLMKAGKVNVASAAYGTRVAPENGHSLPATHFAGHRPFPGRGKSQEALSARARPLSIEQVRELLNKNK